MALALENLQLIFSAIIIYALVYAILIKVNVIEDKKINGVIALMATIITSLTGVVTFSIFYSVRLFVILAMIFFLIIVLVSFIGVDLKKYILGEKGVKIGITIFVVVLFLLILFKSFFALNNSDLSNPNNQTDEINTSVNIGVDTSGIDFNVDDEAFNTFLFLLILGIFVFLMGKS